MRHITFAAFAALALSVTGARAESNYSAATETPMTAQLVQSSCATNEAGSEAIPVFNVVMHETQGGPVLRDGTAESIPVFANGPAAVRSARNGSTGQIRPHG
jgi:hypothetical protein